MAYEPTTWAENDLITAEKLNKLEQGVKNEQAGPAGADGAAAGFGAPTATAEAVENTAQPEVTVKASGSDAAKVFAFHFKIPKGADGQDGATPSAATTEAAGVVKQIANIADLADAPTKENFNALLAALKTAGIMAEA